MKLVNATYVTVWDDNNKAETPCQLNLEMNPPVLMNLQSIDYSNLNLSPTASIIQEYVTYNQVDNVGPYTVTVTTWDV